MDRKRNDLIGDILEASGEKDNYYNEGKGKPLPKSYMKKDILQNFQEKAKDAGYLPPWLSLQREISLLVHDAKNEQDIKVINKKIKKYNTMCPPSMQKLSIQINELEAARKIW
jgi:hypothetical protein